MAERSAVVIGAGIGGLSAAIHLACAGWIVTVFDKAAAVGGKMRTLQVGDVAIDSGPTVLTMPWVFERLFATAGRRLGDYLALQPLEVLARHAWPDGSALDLYRDRARSADAIGALAGADASRGYLRFCADAQRMYNTLRAPFLEATKPNPISLAARIGPSRAGDLMAIRPFDTMWRALRDYFRDPRLRQLFGRYATYCGSSPFNAPATLMLIAHVEQEGVWTVAGGMQDLANALRTLAEESGVRFRLGEGVDEIVVRNGRACGVMGARQTHIAADAVICNADPAALAAGLFGAETRSTVKSPNPRQRSLSAITWSVHAATSGFALSRHNVFFSRDYAREFSDLRSGPARDPTIYVCAQDRSDAPTPSSHERLFVLMNAAADGDRNELSPMEMEACETRMLTKLRQSGLELQTKATVRTGPSDFNRLFPATGGALYGQATHGWAAAFHRPAARTRIPGLYFAGGGVHPGAGVPMTALSGQLAAQQVLKDHASTSRSRPAATFGGTSTA